jgi:CheY-like chemotaxis protein
MSGLHAAVGRRGHVLVIDDEPFVAHALALFLSDEHSITILNDARAALALLDVGEAFDVILCDVRMPEMSGLDFHREVSARFPDHAPRVVFITGGVFRSSDRHYLDSIPNECLDKPPDPFALRALIRERVAARHSSEASRQQSA